MVEPGPKILVIDDEAGMRDYLSFELGMQGYRVSAVEDGEKGMREIERSNFDLVITDIAMPGMNGIRLLEELKKKDPTLEVIVITGHGTIEMAVDAMKKGAYDFLKKPFQLEEISSAVKRALEKKDLKTLIALYESSKVIFSTVKLDELLDSIVDLLHKVINASQCSVMLQDDAGEMTIAAEKGLEGCDLNDLYLDMGRYMANLPKEELKPFLFSDEEGEKPFIREARKKGVEGSFLLFPLTYREKFLGILILYRHARERQLVEGELHNVSIFASQAVQAIQNAKLYERLAAKIQETESAYEKLKEAQEKVIQSEKLASMGRFVAGLSHEVNAALIVIYRHAQTLLQSGAKDPETVKKIEVIEKRAAHCHRITQDLLAFASHRKLNRQSIRLSSLIDEVLELVAAETERLNIEVFREFGDVCTVKVDPDQIREVLINLCNNACHALEETTGPRKLTVRLANEKGGVSLDIADNGPGISKDDMKRIFEPFFTTKPMGKGTGLGLSLVYGVIQKHGGRVTVDTAPDRGTTFRIFFPSAESSVQKNHAT